MNEKISDIKDELDSAVGGDEIELDENNISLDGFRLILSIFQVDKINLKLKTLELKDSFLVISGTSDLIKEEGGPLSIKLEELETDTFVEITAFLGGWDFPGFPSLTLSDASARFRYQGESLGLSGETYGAFKAGNLSLGAIVNFPDTSGGLTFKLNQPPVSLSDLSALDVFNAGEPMNIKVPDELYDLASLALTDLEVSTIDKIITRVIIGVSIPESWEIIPGALSIKDIKISVWLVQPGSDRTDRSIEFSISAILVMGDTDIPIVLEKGSTNAWYLLFATGRGIEIPSLADIMSFAGGEQAGDPIPEEIKNLPAITLANLALEFNPAAKSIESFAFEIKTPDKDKSTSKEDFALQDLYFEMTVLKPFKASERKVSGRAGAKVAIGKWNIAAYGAFEDTFQITGRIEIPVEDNLDLFGVKLKSEDGNSKSVPINLNLEYIQGDELKSYRLYSEFEPGQILSVSSNLAFLRHLGFEMRDLQNDENEGSNELIALELSNLQKPLTLFKRSKSAGEWNNEYFTIENNETKIQADLKLGRSMPFPFLEQSGGILSQRIYVGDAPLHGKSPEKYMEPITLGTGQVEFESRSIGIDIPINIELGEMKLRGNFPLIFDLKKFGVKLAEEGITFGMDEPELQAEELGLYWKFKGTPNEKGAYDFLRLATKDFNYQLQLADGASMELGFRGLSKEAIRFVVEQFSVSQKGLSLVAVVSDDPVTLNSIETKFRFGGTRLEIKENKILDFTLQGSGPLPPALVGDANVDIALQFQTVNGKLRPVSGSASLKDRKLLDCKGTRFQFSIDSIGIQFVYEKKFHFYFTLTGQAKFVPADGDDKDSPLSKLPAVSIDLIEVPLTTDTKVLARYIDFEVVLPKPISFTFLGSYGFELRSFGFQPQCERFGGNPGMFLSGQILFVKGPGDVINPKPDLHKLYIGLPAKGETKPQVAMGALPLSVGAGSKFRLSGAVKFEYSATMQGFTGEATMEVKGLPAFAAAVGFMRVRNDANEPWKRAWFIYLEASHISLEIPGVKFFLREIGLGFGYRYTLVAIKRANEAGSISALITEMKVLSRTAGDLSKMDRWVVDLEKPGEDVHWTIVFRAMFSQMTAATSPLQWKLEKEKMLPNVALFDALVAVRSDLTFFMNVRVWWNTSYGMYEFAKKKGDNLGPLFSGFVLLWPREKKLLAHLASNQEAHLGTTKYPSRPPIHPLVKRAIQRSTFSATLLQQPNLTHFEMGWPNMLRWSDEFGPLKAEIKGGFILRVTDKDLVLGVSFAARASLDFEASVNLGLVGASLSARADGAFSGRFIGLSQFEKDALTLYANVHIDLRVILKLSLWIKIPLFVTTLKLTFSFKFELNFTASLEMGYLLANSDERIGLKGSGYLSISVMGHGLTFAVKVKHELDAVKDAKEITAPYLNIGLEAADGDKSLPPATSSKENTTPMSVPAGEIENLVVDAGDDDNSKTSTDQPAFENPEYSIFTIRHAPDGHHYFVMFPKGGQNGFLAPPALDEKNEIKLDYRIKLPEGAAGRLEQFDPHRENGAGWIKREGLTIDWRCGWEKTVTPEPVKYGDQDGGPDISGGLTLKQYLAQAFVPTEGLPGGDPDPLPSIAATLEDDRVHNPTDDAYEASVIGAVEQFRGSPFFKNDPSLAYDKALSAAFSEDTDALADDGQAAADDNDEKLGRDNTQKQVHQIRSLILHEIIEDVKSFVNDPDHFDTEQSIPFQCGLVFRLDADAVLPNWLEKNPENEDEFIKIQQRIAPGTVELSGPKQVSVFNEAGTGFDEKPPRFERVRHFTDVNTVAIAWDLKWDRPSSEAEDNALNPQHHLSHYSVRRRALDGQTPEVVFDIRSAGILHRDPDKPEELQLLKPRFQLVDHFNHETLEVQAGLPAQGRSYLYSITPVDHSGRSGLPLTLVATRYPNEPPQVPADGKLMVDYDLTEKFAAETVKPMQLLEPQSITLRWTEPKIPNDGIYVPVNKVRVLFRREKTLPIGSYGLDGATQSPKTGMLPTSNARQLPSDLVVEIDASELDPAKKGVRNWVIAPSELQDARVLPVSQNGTREWKPEAWRIFLQTESVNKVLSALAPVQLEIRFDMSESSSGHTDGIGAIEERRPSELEWMPAPMQLPMLPPEDQSALIGNAHFPMPGGTMKFSDFAADQAGTTGPIKYRSHPKGKRVVRFQWNQGPSKQPNYPIAATAGFNIHQLDIDANTEATFNQSNPLISALKAIQEIQMIPSGELALHPGDTLIAQQWEAWYPSDVKRRIENTGAGSTLKTAPWFSWRDSILEWPEWPEMDGDAWERTDFYHPFLRSIIAILEGKYLVELQGVPPYKAMNWRTYMTNTSAEADPYGWTVLQQFGLSITLSLRKKEEGWDKGSLIAQADMVNAVKTAIDTASDEPTTPAGKAQALAWSNYLFAEILVQPNKKVSLKDQSPITPDAMLAMLQLSLRPTWKQVFFYYLVTFDLEKIDPENNTATLTIPYGLKGVSFIHLENPDLIQIEVDHIDAKKTEVDLDLQYEAEANKERHLSRNTKCTLLIRTRSENTLDGLTLTMPPPPDGDAVTSFTSKSIPISILSASAAEETQDASLTQLFTFGPVAVAERFKSKEDEKAHWDRFQKYVLALNPPAGEEPRISFPTTTEAHELMVADYLAWSQRFFDHSQPEKIDTSRQGPWLATAYPNSGTPALVPMDASGRLTYDHIVLDKWAHNYRYYFEPYGRYDKMWSGLKNAMNIQSDSIRKDETDRDVFRGDGTTLAESAGLDVVLDRIQKVDAPTILYSTRLDLPTKNPANPPPPGAAWEVAIAQHAEQVLLEYNSTVARQLDFRQVAFSLMRSFDYQSVLRGFYEGLTSESGDDSEPDWIYPASEAPDLPTLTSDALTNLTVQDRENRLALPLRLGSFQQAAQVLQWDSLPFFYRHRLLTIAQTSKVVSEVTGVDQQDFEYIAPAAIGRFTVSGGHAYIEFLLCRLWDSLPGAVQEKWPMENPDIGPKNKPGSAPDLDVIYNIVAFYDGNVEVQAKIVYSAELAEFRIVPLVKEKIVFESAGAPDYPEALTFKVDEDEGRIRVRALLKEIPDMSRDLRFEIMTVRGSAQPTRVKFKDSENES